ncbi:hypothetical protein RJ639_016833 [Escallonia herrerae]|uniref:Uncharacterized protein n=1 Tax=Escallonia herrerae TaxID=1293975 RepID=A0AA89AKJ4_9ASTE|nr:hypothetical protein RJ639_016833 [Escallonia herrerae]
MAAPLFLRGAPLLRLRLHHHKLAAAVGIVTRRPPSAFATRPEEHSHPTAQSTAVPGVKDPPRHPRWDDPDYRKWKDKEEEILKDIESITLLTKEILHSDRYKDGERLTFDDEEAVVDKLLAYHPHSEDKIGCGLDSIMFG